jgi:hypothetical protein
VCAAESPPPIETTDLEFAAGGDGRGDPPAASADLPLFV